MATIGDSIAPSQNTINYDDLLTSTMFAYRDTMADNIFKDSAFLAFLRESNAVTRQDGGERIAMSLVYDTNKTVESKSAYGVIDTTPQEEFTTAFYEWREIAGSISISRKEERQNSGESRLFNLLEGKVRVAEMTMREELNRQLLQGTVSASTLVPGNSALDMYPLGYFFRRLNGTDPTTGGNVGNISGSSNSWWRHKTAIADTTTAQDGNSFALNVSSYAGLKVAFRRMHNYCGRGGGGFPNLVICDQVAYETYENALDVNIRFQNTRMADLGFDTIKLRNATVLWDEVVPDMEAGSTTITKGTAFFLNTEFYKLVIDSETDLITTPFIEPENQTVRTAKVLFMGNAAVSNMRKHGVLYAIGQTISS